MGAVGKALAKKTSEAVQWAVPVGAESSTRFLLLVSLGGQTCRLPLLCPLLHAGGKGSFLVYSPTVCLDREELEKKSQLILIAVLPQGPKQYLKIGSSHVGKEFAGDSMLFHTSLD